MITRLLRNLQCCSSSSVQHQITPSSWVNQYLDSDDIDGPIANLGDGMFKTKPISNIEEAEIDNDMFLLVIDIRIDSNAENLFSRHLLASSGLQNCYCYDKAGSGSARSDLVKLLRRTLGGDYLLSTPDDFLKFIRAAGELSKLLDNYQEFPDGHFPDSPFNGNCFTSIERAIMIADVFILANINIAANGAFFEMKDAYMPALQGVLKSIVNLGNSIQAGDASHAISLWTQVIARSISLMMFLIRHLSLLEPQQVEIAVLSALVNMAPTICSGIQLIKTLCGSDSVGYYAANIAFWHCILQLYQFLQHTAKVAGVLQHNSKSYKQSSLLCTKVLNAFLSTMPSGYELTNEIQRIVSNYYAMHRMQNDHLLLQWLVDEANQRSNAPDGKNNLLSALEHRNDGDRSAYSEGPMSKSTDRSQFVSFFHQLSFHFRFLVSGLTFLFRIYDLQHYYEQSDVIFGGLTSTLPNKFNWMMVVSEILRSILMRSRRFASTHHSGHDIVCLGPYFGDILLRLVLSEPQQSGNVALDWIYWDFAKSLGDFTDRIKRKHRSLRVVPSGNNASGHTVRSAGSATASSMSMPSADDADKRAGPGIPLKPYHGPSAASMTPSQGNLEHFQLNMETPFRSTMKPPAAASSAAFTPIAKLEKIDSTKAESKALHPLFSVGDLVDGICTLQNCTSRWFPGAVAEVIVDEQAKRVAYTVQYNDGDIGKDLAESDVRATKRRTPARPAPTQSPPEVTSNLLSLSGVVTPKLDESALTSSSSAFEKPSIDPLNIPSTTSNESQRNNFFTPQKGTTSEFIGGGAPESPDFNVSPLSESHNIIDLSASSLMLKTPVPNHFSTTPPVTAPGTDITQNTSTSEDADATMLFQHLQQNFSIKSVQTSGEEEDPLGDEDEDIGFRDHEAVGDGGRAGHRYDAAARGDEDDDECSEDSEDRIYAIPSVFEGTSRPNNFFRPNEDKVPRMQFSELNTSGALPHTSSSVSLSGALVSEHTSGSTMVNNSSMPLMTASYDMSTGRSHTQQVSYRSIDGHASFHNHSMSGARSSYMIGLTKSPAAGVQADGYEQLTPSGTRMLSWRAEESARISDHTHTLRSSAKQMPAMPPSDAHVHAAAEVGKMRSSFKSNRYSPGNSVAEPIVEEFVDMDDSTLHTLTQTYCLVSMVLLQRCVVQERFLSPDCCMTNTTEAAAPKSLESSGTFTSFSGLGATASPSFELEGQPPVNILFHIREFLDVCPKEFRLVDSMAQICLLKGAAYSRVCKLLCGSYFSNCLPTHMDTAVKIGEGGFGSVFRVCCPVQSCGHFKQYQNCYSCHQANSFYGGITSHNDCSIPCSCWAVALKDRRRNHSFAVKRIARERSMFDQPMIYDLFNEITALEQLSGRIGVCGLEDYGIHGSEYWIVMESGGLNLSEWRLKPFAAFEFIDPSAAATAMQHTPNERLEGRHTITMSDMAVYLCLFLDALLILQSVHEADIVHFDIKCNNFILRDDPRKMIATMRAFHQRGQPSGVLFLADFGEAVPLCATNDMLKTKKCRGTLNIQSPEMLCISESSEERVQRLSVRNISPPLFPIRGRKILSTIESMDSTGSSNNSIKLAPSLPDQLSKANINSHHQSERESRNGKKVFPLPGKSSDVWSLGCLLHEIITGDALFVDKSWTELYCTLCMEKFAPLCFDGLSEALVAVNINVTEKIKSLCDSMLQQEPQQRATIEQLISEVGAVLRQHFLEYVIKPALVDRKKSYTKPLQGAFSSKDLFTHTTSSSALLLGSPEQPAKSSFSAMSPSQPPLRDLSKHIADLLQREDAVVACPCENLHFGNNVFMVLEPMEGVVGFLEDRLLSRKQIHGASKSRRAELPNILQHVSATDTEVKKCDVSSSVAATSQRFLRQQLRVQHNVVWVRLRCSVPGTEAGEAGNEEEVMSRFRRCSSSFRVLSVDIDFSGDGDHALHVSQQVEAAVRSLCEGYSEHTVVLLTMNTVRSATALSDIKPPQRVLSPATCVESPQQSKQCSHHKAAVTVAATIAGLCHCMAQDLRGPQLSSKAESRLAVLASAKIHRVVYVARCISWLFAACDMEVAGGIAQHIIESCKQQ